MSFWNRLWNRLLRRGGASRRSDLGGRVLSHAYARMQIDEAWSIREHRAFTWWGHRLAQRVWAEEPRLSQDMMVVRVHAETDLLRNVEPQTRTAALVGAINAYASLSAAVWDPSDRRIRLRCTMFVHDENVAWAEELFTHAIALQAAEAHSLVGTIAEQLAAEGDYSSHPVRGPRPAPDEMLGVIDSFRRPAGAQPSTYSGQDFERTLDLLGKRFVANGDDQAFVVEFPFTDEEPAVMKLLRGTGPPGTALLTASSKRDHPRLGSGALLQLQLPIESDWDLAARLNVAECDEWTASHLLGGWCVGPAHPNGPPLVMFVSFLPSAVRTPSVFINCVLSMAARARWAGGKG